MRELFPGSGSGSRTGVVLAVLWFGLAVWSILTGDPWPAVGYGVVGALWLVAWRYRETRSKRRSDGVVRDQRPRFLD